MNWSKGFPQQEIRIAPKKLKLEPVQPTEPSKFAGPGRRTKNSYGWRELLLKSSFRNEEPRLGPVEAL
jgi:hypothetical protein